MSLNGLSGALGIVLSFLGLAFGFASTRLKDHPRYKYWCSVAAYCSVLGGVWVICSIFVVLLFHMPAIRGSIAVAAVLVFVSAVAWPRIENIIAQGTPFATPTAQSIVSPDYAVSLHLIYVNHRFQLYNDGKTNLSLWGSQVGDGPEDILSEPRIISPSPSTYYFIPGESFEAEVKTKVLDGDMIRSPLKLFLTNVLGSRYIARFILLVHREHNVISVDTQLVGLEQADWNTIASPTPSSTQDAVTLPWPERETLRQQTADLIKNSRRAARMLSKTPDATYTNTLTLIALKYSKPSLEIKKSVRNILGFPLATPLNHLPLATKPDEFLFIAEVYERLLDKISSDAPATVIDDPD